MATSGYLLADVQVGGAAGPRCWPGRSASGLHPLELAAGSEVEPCPVQNAGYIAADYTISVVNCTIGVLPVPVGCTKGCLKGSSAVAGTLPALVPELLLGWAVFSVLAGSRRVSPKAALHPPLQQAQYASIAAQAIRRFTFQLQMQTDQAIVNASCTVAATDATGAVSATDSVTFYTNATKCGLGVTASGRKGRKTAKATREAKAVLRSGAVMWSPQLLAFSVVVIPFLLPTLRYDPVPNQSNLNGQVTGPGTPVPSVCAAQCPQILNIKCSLTNRCYGRLAQVRCWRAARPTAHTSVTGADDQRSLAHALLPKPV